jgi:hypothetical protein
MGYARPHPPAENQSWGNAIVRRSRAAGLLRRLPLRARGKDQRGSMARRNSAVRTRAPFRLSGMRSTRRRHQARLGSGTIATARQWLIAAAPTRRLEHGPAVRLRHGAGAVPGHGPLASMARMALSKRNRCPTDCSCDALGGKIFNVCARKLPPPCLRLAIEAGRGK